MNDLLLYSKTESLFFRVYPTFRNYPKSETHSLCRMVKEHYVELLKHIELANKVKSKRIPYLQHADAYLQGIKSLTKLSHKQKYISRGFYEECSDALSEINALLVGYFKSASNKNYTSKFTKSDVE